MRTLFARWTAAFILLATAGLGSAAAQTCVTIDEPRDMLTPSERTAARLLVERQFTLAGHAVSDTDCQAVYRLSHIRLGTTIVVTLTGPAGTREGTALGLDDLPAVYSQMVRALLTGQPMGSPAVLDRTNVSAVQDLPARRVESDGAWYARVGVGHLVGSSTRQGASFGFGYRAEFDHLGLEVSFLNLHTAGQDGYLASTSSAGSFITLEGLYFAHPKADRSPYLGAGLSYGRTEAQRSNGTLYPAWGNAAGLQGELTAGYEIGRTTSARVFVETDITLPFYRVAFETLTYEPPRPGAYQPPTVTVERRYLPSIALSVGLGWQRRRR